MTIPGHLKKPWLVLLRFPIVFGSFLLLMAGGFIYRDTFLTDLPEKQSKMLQEDPENRETIKKFIKERNEKYKL